jgi:hypothetical protein
MVVGQVPLKNGGSTLTEALVTENDDGNGSPLTKTVVPLVHHPAELVAVKV